MAAIPESGKIVSSRIMYLFGFFRLIFFIGLFSGHGVMPFSILISSSFEVTVVENRIFLFCSLVLQRKKNY